MSFPDAMLLNGDFPESQGPDAVLLPLGGTVVLQPAAGGTLALEVEDEENRPVAATLIQFREPDAPREGGGQYLRIPADEDSQASNVIENPFEVDPALCEGLCAGLFTLEVVEAIEFDNGDVTSQVGRQIIVDCTEHGDAGACDEDSVGDDEALLVADGVLCGSLADDELIYTGEPLFDGHFDAVGRLSASAQGAAGKVDEVIADIGEQLGVSDGDAAEVAAAATTAIEANTEMGLTLQIGEIGCGARAIEAHAAIGRCDPDAFDDFDGIACGGDCRALEQGSDCGSDADTRCRGLTQDRSCDGTCTGACTVELTSPGVCEGTCSGTCSGPCPDDGSGGCLGPCEGDCTGECRSTSAGECAGLCTGLCDGTGSDDPCAGSTVRYCVPAAADSSIDCLGACFGQAVLPGLSTECGAAPLALASIYPLCEPTLVQISFAFAPGLDAAAQMGFAQLADGLNAPLRGAYEILSRIDLLASAGTDLQAEANAALSDALDEADGDDAGVECAMDRLGDAMTLLESELMLLADKQSEAMMVIDALMAAGSM